MMEILSSNDGFLTDVDVNLLLQERVRNRTPHSNGDVRLGKQLAKNRNLIEKQVLDHMKSSPVKSMTAESVLAFLGALDGLCAAGGYTFSLTEKLQLINLRPSAPVELHLIVEDCDERLNDQAMEELLACIAEHLGSEEEEGEEGGEEGHGEGNDEEEAGRGEGEERGGAQEGEQQVEEGEEDEEELVMEGRYGSTNDGGDDDDGD